MHCICTKGTKKAWIIYFNDNFYHEFNILIMLGSSLSAKHWIVKNFDYEKGNVQDLGKNCFFIILHINFKRGVFLNSIVFNLY